MNHERNTLTNEVIAALTAPFPCAIVDIKPGAVDPAAGHALVLPFVGWRVYVDRLDTVVGSANWSIALHPWGEHRLIATLTILGVRKSATGEGDPHDPNCGTSAEAQAKKRACAEFGLGRYLYRLPTTWAPGRGTKQQFRFDDPAGVVRRMYHQAGLPVTPAPAEPQPTATEAPKGDPHKLARARAALQSAEQRTSPDTRATDRQCGMIAGIARTMAPPILTAIGLEVDLTQVQSKQDVANLGLTRQQASHIISLLQANELVA